MALAPFRLDRGDLPIEELVVQPGQPVRQPYICQGDQTGAGQQVVYYKPGVEEVPPSRGRDPPGEHARGWHRAGPQPSLNVVTDVFADLWLVVNEVEPGRGGQVPDRPAWSARQQEPQLGGGQLRLPGQRGHQPEPGAALDSLIQPVDRHDDRGGRVGARSQQA